MAINGNTLINMHTKYGVLSYLVGNYDKTHKIIEKTPNCQYVLVTDNPSFKDESGYEVVYAPELSRFNNNFDKILYIRYHPFLFIDCDIVLRIDASVQVRDDLTRIFQDFEKGDSQLAVHIHPTRNTVYDELVAWVQQRGMDVDEANKVLQFMTQFEGYNVKDYKHLIQLSWSMEKNTPAIQRLDELTYAWNKYLGNNSDFRCDQCVFSFVVAKYFNQLPMDIWDMRILFGKYFLWYPHNSDVPFQFDMKELKPAYWLNKRIQTKREQDL